MNAQIRHAVFRLLFILLSGITVPVQVIHAQWSVQDGHTPENLVDVVMLDSLKAIAIGDRNSILRTSDAGFTWVNETVYLSAIFNWNAISFSDTLNGTVVGDHTVWGTTDGGVTWNVRTPPSLKKCLSVLQINPSVVYVGADSGWIYHSADTGKTWFARKISAWEIRDIFPWRGPIVLGAPMYFALTPYSLCALNELHAFPQWIEDTLEYMQGLGSEAFAGEFCNGGGAGFIVGVFGDLRASPAILRKSMPSNEWVSESPSSGDGILFSVSAPSANTIYVCGSQGMAFKSTNGGDSWNSLSMPTDRRLHAVNFFNDLKGFAVGDSGTILYTDNGGGSVDAVETNGPMLREFTLDQNYPNPFNPTTNIRYHIPTAGVVSLRVFDLLGKEITMVADERRSPGTYNVQWNAAGLPSGVYFYRLRANGFTIVKKMLLLR